MSEQQPFQEHLEAIVLARRVLDRHDLDPDGDLCMLARQLLRRTEERDALRKTIDDLQPRTFPMQCDCCGGTMTSTDDYEYHGIGNCVFTCAECGGCGWEKP